MALVLPLVASAVSFEVKIDGIYYILSTMYMDAVVTSGDTPYTGSVTIPETVTYNDETYSVVSINGSTFYNCTDLTSVVFPNTVSSIGSFYGCSSLTSLTIPNSVTSISNGAFHGCSSLTSLTIPNSVTLIGENTFYGCPSLTSLTIPSSVTSIGKRAFEDCSGLTPWTKTSCASEHCLSCSLA